MQRNPETDQDARIRAAQSGDELAFETLISEHYDQIYHYACRISGNRIDAEDITQQSCMKLGRAIGQFRFESAFTTWLYRLVTNCATDYRRSAASRTNPEPPMNAESEKVATADSTALIQLEQVLRQVDDFGEGFRETVVLVLGEGLTHKEAADVLGVKESTISWRLHETRKKLAALEVE